MHEYHRVNIVDLEATCDDPNPPNFNQEVIEIGIVLVNTKTLVIEKEESILVEPYGEITPFCTKLTTLTLQQIRAADAPRFKGACEHLETGFLARDRSWASWGDFDRNLMERQARREGVKYPFGGTHTNLRVLFTQIMGLEQRVGMPEALRLLGLPLDGTHHRGIDDARNIARIFLELLKRSRQ